MTSVLSDTSGDHAIVTETPDGIYYRASALGGCLRALWAARSGQPAAPTPAKMQAVFDRGHEIEPIVINMLKEQGWNIYDEQKEVILPVTFEEFPDTVSQTPPPITKPLFILGHIDALGAPPPGISGPESHTFEHVIEIKGFGPDLWAKYKAGGLRGMFGYSVQTSAYQYALGFADLAFVVYNKETGELDIQFFERPVLERWELDVIVAVVEECYRSSQMPSCTLNYPCPYYHLHDPLPVPSALVDTLAVTYLNIGEQIKTLEATRKAISGKIKNLLPEGEADKWQSADVGLSLSPNASSWNTEALDDLLTKAELDRDDYRKSGTGTQLRITDRRKRG